MSKLVELALVTKFTEWAMDSDDAGWYPLDLDRAALLDDYDDLKNLAEIIGANVVETGRAVRALLENGVLEAKFGLAGIWIGLANIAAEEEERYSQLKASVYSKAMDRGLRPRWSDNGGWCLKDSSGQVVARGNMRELSEWLAD